MAVMAFYAQICLMGPMKDWADYGPQLQQPQTASASQYRVRSGPARFLMASDDGGFGSCDDFHPTSSMTLTK